MSNDTGRPRPNVVQYIAYCYGRVLPDSMKDWVRNDLGGQGCDRPDGDPVRHSGNSGAGPVLADPHNTVCAREHDGANLFAVSVVHARAE